MLNFKLILDEPSATFSPLSPVNGQIILESEDSLKVQNITVKLLGVATVKFSEEKDGTLQMFSDEQIIVEKDFVLWARIDDEKFHAGQHDFSFKFLLPEECPPSFVGENGQIAYKLMAKVIASGGNDVEIEEAITVSPMTYISTNSPVICSTAFKSVNITASIPFRIYNLNDEIPLSVEISNLSDNAVESIEAGLSWTSSFTGKSQSSSEAMCNTVKGELDYTNSPFSVPPGATLTWNHVLKSSATLPSITSCPILSHNYLIFVKIHFADALERHLEFFIPLILSKIAFHETVEGGETMLPSESTESGTYPQVTVPLSQVDQKQPVTSEMSLTLGEGANNSVIEMPESSRNIESQKGCGEDEPILVHV